MLSWLQLFEPTLCEMSSQAVEREFAQIMSELAALGTELGLKASEDSESKLHNGRFNYIQSTRIRFPIFQRHVCNLMTAHTCSLGNWLDCFSELCLAVFQKVRQWTGKNASRICRIAMNSIMNSIMQVSQLSQVSPMNNVNIWPSSVLHLVWGTANVLTRQMDVETLCFHGAGQERPR